jgi:hypothetical protein
MTFLRNIEFSLNLGEIILKHLEIKFDQYLMNVETFINYFKTDVNCHPKKTNFLSEIMSIV